MSFRVLPGSVFAGPPEFALGFRVIWKGKGQPMLRVALSAALMREMGWAAGDRLQLFVGEDEDAGNGQLIAVQSGGRKLTETAKDGRAECLLHYTAVEAEFFPQYDALVELEVLERNAEASELTFEMPVMPGAEGKGGEVCSSSRMNGVWP